MREKAARELTLDDAAAWVGEVEEWGVNARALI
jgi:hypothetical protein